VDERARRARVRHAEQQQQISGRIAAYERHDIPALYALGREHGGQGLDACPRGAVSHPFVVELAK
jgi:hypothetical protein